MPTVQCCFFQLELQFPPLLLCEAQHFAHPFIRLFRVRVRVRVRLSGLGLGARVRVRVRVSDGVRVRVRAGVRVS